MNPKKDLIEQKINNDEFSIVDDSNNKNLIKSSFIFQPNVSVEKRYDFFRVLSIIIDLKSDATCSSIKDKPLFISFIDEAATHYEKYFQLDYILDKNVYKYFSLCLKNIIIQIETKNSPIISIIADYILNEFDGFLLVEEKIGLSFISKYPTKDNWLNIMNKLRVFK